MLEDGGPEVLRDVAIATTFWLPIWGAHWHHLANTTELPYAAAMRPFVKLLSPLVLFPSTDFSTSLG